jgi:hypothetical protein
MIKFQWRRNTIGFIIPIGRATLELIALVAFIAATLALVGAFS